MVFNPSFEGSVRFNQPVAPGPTGAEVLSNIVGGLGVFETVANSRQQPELNFQNATRMVADELGISNDVSQWTSADIRRASSIFPQFGSDWVDLTTDLGGGGDLLAQQNVRDGFAEWQASARGTVAYQLSVNANPDNPEAQERDLQRRYLEWQETQARRTELAERATELGNTQELADDYWDMSVPDLMDNAQVFGSALYEVRGTLLRGGTVDLTQFTLDQQGTTLAQVIGMDQFTAQDLPIVREQLREYLRQGAMMQARADLGVNRPRPPSGRDEYWDDVLAPFDLAIAALESASNPETAISLERQQEYLDFLEGLDSRQAHVVMIMERYGHNSELMNEIMADDDLRTMFLDLARPGVRPTPEVIERGSVDGAVSFTNSIGLIIRDVASREGEIRQDEADSLSQMIAYLDSASVRADMRFDSSDSYEVLLDQQVLEALGRGRYSNMSRESLARFIQNDLTHRLDQINQSGLNFATGLSFENGRLVADFSTMGWSGEETGQQVASQNLVTAIEEFNEVLDIMGQQHVITFMGGDFVATLEQNLTSERRDSEFSTNPSGFGMMGGSTPAPAQRSTLRDPMDSPPEATLRSPAVPTQSTSGRISPNTPLPSQTRGTGTTMQGDFNSQVIASLAGTESSGNFQETNDVAGAGGRGHYGRLQWSRARFTEAQAAIPALRGITIEQFIAPGNEALQERAELWHIQDYRNRFRRDGLLQYVGTTINGVPVTESGMLAAAHLGGYEGLTQLLSSGGSYNPADAYGTDLIAYMMRHGGIGENGAPSEPISFSQQPQYSPNAVMLQEGIFINPGVALNGNANATLDMTNASRLTREYAGERMQNETIPAFMQMQQFFGGTIAINDAIAQAGTSRENSTTGSRHFHGDALDLDISGMSNEEQLRAVQAAYAAGFRGFGFGNGLLHIDLGASRSWAYGNDTFAGLPLSEVQAMVANGTFAGLAPMVDDTGPFQPTEDPGRAAAMARLSGPDFDPGVPDPTNFTQYETNTQDGSQEVEQGSEGTQGTVTPEQGGDASQAAAQRLSGAPVDAEIQDLITALTTGASEQELESIRELLRQVTTGETRR